jgi:hypothetical protein
MAVTEPAARRAQLASALAHLEMVAWDINRAATWAANEGHETESEMLEDAARSVLASCWLLERPFRPQLPPGAWRQQQAG